MDVLKTLFQPSWFLVLQHLDDVPVQRLGRLFSQWGNFSPTESYSFLAVYNFHSRKDDFLSAYQNTLVQTLGHMARFGASG